MDLEKIIIQTLIEYQFGDNLKNGDYITGVKKLYFGEVAATVVKKQIIMSIDEEQLQSLSDGYDNEQKQLFLSGVSQQSELLELLTEIANSDTLYSNTRHKLIAKKLLSSNCG